VAGRGSGSRYRNDDVALGVAPFSSRFSRRSALSGISTFGRVVSCAELSGAGYDRPGVEPRNLVLRIKSRRGLSSRAEGMLRIDGTGHSDCRSTSGGTARGVEILERCRPIPAVSDDRDHDRLASCDGSPSPMQSRAS
jgi:hypothetical protein